MNLGLSLAPDRVCAVLPGGGGLTVEREGTDPTPSLLRLRDELGVARARVAVALLPPLVEVRRLTLPRLRGAELARVLTRDVARYFLDGHRAGVAAGDVLARGGSPVPVLAACALRGEAEAVAAAVRSAGWSLETIVPAHAAWLADVRATWRERAGCSAVVVAGGATIEVLLLDDGVVTAVRRFPSVEDGLAPLAEAVATTSGGVAVIGSEPVRAFLAERLAGREVRGAVEDALTVAATGALRARGPELLSEAVLGERRRGERRLAARLAAAAVLCLAGAGALEFLGTQRELDAVAARRAEIRAAVAAAMARREAAGDADQALATIADLEATSPRWSHVLADLADHLPRDAYVLAVRGAGDSVALEGVARQAATVFQAVQQMPGVAGVRAQAPVRQGIAEDGSVLERFVLGGELRRP